MDYSLLGYYSDNVVLPVAMILYVILHFREDKNIYIYAAFMSFLFLFVPVWLLVTIGLVLIGLDQASKWAKERKEHIH